MFAAILTLIDAPQGATKTRVIHGPGLTRIIMVDPKPAQPCDDVWSARGERFMLYDVVVHDRRFGPEVKGRTTSEVLQELQERLCTDPALLYDLESYDEYGITFHDDPVARRMAILKILYGSKTAWRARVVALMNKVSSPRLIQSRSAYTSWYYTRGSNSAQVPPVFIGEVGPTLSNVLVFTNEARQQRALRLQCGFQPYEQV